MNNESHRVGAIQTRLVLALIVASVPVSAAGEPLPSPLPPEVPAWEKAPRPAEASGIVEPEQTPGDGWLWVPRAVVFVPKVAVNVVMAPARLAAWAWDRYQLNDRFYDVFFNVEGTAGAYPTLLFETGFGLNVGARAVHKDLFGRQERVDLRAGFGGQYQQRYAIKLNTGQRLGKRLALSLEGRFERRNEELFFGIGNGDEISTAMNVDPVSDDTAVQTRFREQLARLVLGAELRLPHHFEIRPTLALVYRDFSTARNLDDAGIADVYNVENLAGFDSGASNFYGELELRYDSRRQANEMETAAIDATGWLLSGYAAWQQGFDSDPSAFMRYGFDLQRFINVYGGSRVLELRVFSEAIASAGPDLDDVPFVDLPRLGGSRILRGYEADRFRDRIVVAGSAEYIWSLGVYTSAELFVDVGRPYRRWGDVDVGDYDSLRVGYGAGLLLHTKHSFYGRVHVASSIDGGLMFNFSFNPAYERHERAGKH